MTRLPAALVASLLFHGLLFAGLVWWGLSSPDDPARPRPASVERRSSPELVVRYVPARPPAHQRRTEKTIERASERDAPERAFALGPAAPPPTEPPRSEHSPEDDAMVTPPAEAVAHSLSTPPVEPEPPRPPRHLDPARPSPPPSARTRERPTLLGELRPRYPRECRRSGHEGTVELLLAVDPGGRVIDVQITRHARCRHLDAAAIETAEQLRFLPAVRDGQPVASTTPLTIRFTLSDEAP